MMRLCYVSDIPPLKQLIENIEGKLSSAAAPESGNVQSITSTQVTHAMPQAMRTNITSFDRLVEWVETQKDPHLSFFLKRDLRVHGFKQGYIECSLKNLDDQPLLKQLKHLLQTQLNETWVFELVYSTTVEPNTLHEQIQLHEAEAKQRAIDSELVQHALHTFEGANIVVERALLES
jgi:hypothetical protein